MGPEAPRHTPKPLPASAPGRDPVLTHVISKVSITISFSVFAYRRSHSLCTMLKVLLTSCGLKNISISFLLAAR